MRPQKTKVSNTGKIDATAWQTLTCQDNCKQQDEEEVLADLL